VVRAHPTVPDKSITYGLVSLPRFPENCAWEAYGKHGRKIGPVCASRKVCTHDDLAGPKGKALAATSMNE
jgi:hypothetical protein